MLDTYTSDNHRDFNARYSETYGWLHDGDKKHFVFLTHTDGNAVYFNRSGDVSYSALINKGVIFEFIPVDRGYFTTIDGAVYYLSRVPARQWKRGISETNTVVRDLNNLTVPITYKLLASIFNPEHSPHKFTGDNNNGQFIISKHFAVNVGVVLFYNQPVGFYRDGIIRLASDLVFTELQDTINRNNLPLKVTIDVNS